VGLFSSSSASFLNFSVMSQYCLLWAASLCWHEVVGCVPCNWACPQWWQKECSYMACM